MLALYLIEKWRNWWLYYWRIENQDISQFMAYMIKPIDRIILIREIQSVLRKEILLRRFTKRKRDSSQNHLEKFIILI